MMDLARYRGWVVLNLLPDVGRVRTRRLVERFGSPEAVLAASPAQLAEVPDVGPLTIQSIVDHGRLCDPDAELARVEREGVGLVCLDDPDYPENLRRVGAPPPLLYVKGALEASDRAAVAVIGARRMSRYGREVTEAIAGDLARAGVTVVSGLALGVDSAAHRAALDAGGRTIACLGNGLGSVYPAQHKKLAEEIAAGGGALVSEMPMEARPDAGSFPQRNAIIAGLSLGVAITEAGLKSGTSITAGCALEENRAVYAVPGDIQRVNSMGTNRMIRDGAHLVTCAQDILVDLHDELAGVLSSLPELADQVRAESDDPPPLPDDLTEIERAIHNALELDPLPVDLITEALGDEGPSMGQVMSALLSLELRGLVRQEPGKMFRRVR